MEEIYNAARHLYEWQCAGATHFTAKLFELIAKADVKNRGKIRLGFPTEVFIFEEWQRSEKPADFYMKYKLITREGLPL